MESAVIERKGLKRKLEIIIPAEEVEKSFSRQCDHIQKKVRLSGFRKGKIPLSLLKKNYSQEIWEKALDDLFQNFYPKAVTKNLIQPAGSPVLLNIKLEDAKPCTLTLELEVHPEVQVEHCSFKITTQNTDVTEKEVEEALNRLRILSSEIKKETVKGPVQTGDLVSLSLKCFHKDRAVKQLTREEMTLYVGDDSIAADFDHHLTGLNQNETKEFHFTFPGHHPDSKLAGKTCLFKLQIKAIRKIVPPELNDEFARKHKVESLENLKRNIKKNLITEKKTAERRSQENEIIKQLISANPADLPESLVKEQTETLQKQEREALQKQGLTPAVTEQKLKERAGDFEKRAREGLHGAYLVKALISKLKITVGEEDIERHIKTTTPKADPREVKRILQTRGQWESFLSQLIRIKLMDHLIETAEKI